MFKIKYHKMSSSEVFYLKYLKPYILIYMVWIVVTISLEFSTCRGGVTRDSIQAWSLILGIPDVHFYISHLEFV